MNKNSKFDKKLRRNSNIKTKYQSKIIIDSIPRSHTHAKHRKHNHR